MEFARGAKLNGLMPITGAEVTLRGCFAGSEDVSAETRRSSAGRTAGNHAISDSAPGTSADPAGPHGGHHVTVLAETTTGYANVCRLLTTAHMESPREDPRLALDTLLDPERAEGLILLTGCRRSPLLAALDSSVTEGETLARRLLEAFGEDRVFVELQDNRVKGDVARLRTLGALADRLRIPVVATGNMHYHRPERHHLHDVLVAIRNRATLEGSHGLRRPNVPLPSVLTRRDGGPLRGPPRRARRHAERSAAGAST